MNNGYSVVEYWDAQQSMRVAIRIPGERKRHGVSQCRVLMTTLEIKFIPTRTIKRTLEAYPLQTAYKHFVRIVKEHRTAGLSVTKAQAVLRGMK